MKLDYGEAGPIKQMYRNARWEVSKRWIEMHPNMDIIAITGSVGKTTQKNIIASVLSESFPTSATKENLDPIFNIPNTALKTAHRAKKFVAECGVDGVGQMDSYLDLISPRVGVITRFSEAHIDVAHFKDFEELISEKRKLADAIPSYGWLFLNGNDERVRQLSEDSQAHVVTVGFGEENNIYCNSFMQEITPEGLPKSTIKVSYGFGEEDFDYQLLGRHNVTYVMTGIGIGMMMGMDFHSIQEGLSKVSSEKGRLNPVRTNYGMVIDDTYNASPVAVKASIDILSELGNGGSKMLVLGDMRELGDSSEFFHSKIGEYAAQSGIDTFITFGDESKPAAESFGRMTNTLSQNMQTHEDIANHIKMDPHDLTLIKGSRFMQMEKVIDLLV